MRRTYLLLLLGVLTLPGCSAVPDFWVEAKPNQKRVLVSFPPLYAITHAVAGDDAYVLSLLSGKGPHDYDGAATDLFKVNKADLLIYNGLTLDDTFIAKMLTGHRNKTLVTLNVGEVLEQQHHEREEKNKTLKDKLPPLLLGGGQVHIGKDGKAHKHGDLDPHVWLGPDQAIAMTEIIAGKLGDIDKDHKENYHKRAAEFIEKLKKLKSDGQAALKDKKHKNIVTMHEAFKYFGQANGLEIVDTIQIRPGMDPDAFKTMKLVELCGQKDVKVIAIEPQYSRAPAAALQRSLKAKGIEVEIIELDPLETVSLPPGKRNPDPDFYLQKMRENIATLAKALP